MRLTLKKIKATRTQGMIKRNNWRKTLQKQPRFAESNFRSTFQMTLDCYGKPGCALDLPSSVETGVKTKSWCAMICKIQMNCTSFSYFENNKTCQLFRFLPFKITSYPKCYNYYMPSRIVLPTNGNLASKRQTCQSSTNAVPNGNLSSWLAVDDFHAASIWMAHCAQTKDPDGGENWFMVDLRQTVGVSRVRVLTFSSSSTEFERYLNLTIGLTNDSWLVKRPVRNTYPLCGIYPKIPSYSSFFDVNCSTNGAQPVRYVIVQQTPVNLSTGGRLSLCEVQVF